MVLLSSSVALSFVPLLLRDAATAEYCEKLNNNGATINLQNTNTSKLIHDKLWDTFSVQQMENSVEVILGFNITAACELEKQKVTAMSCILLYAMAIFTERGELAGTSDYHDSSLIIYEFSLHHKANISNLQSYTWYVLKLKCLVKFKDEISKPYFTANRECRTLGQLKPPLLRGYAFHEIYGSYGTASTAVVLLWSPVLQNKKLLKTSLQQNYLFRCIEYTEHCACRLNFWSCKLCVEEKMNVVWQHTDKVSRRDVSTQMNIEHNPAIYSYDDQVTQTSTKIVCSVWATHSGQQSPGSKPVHINLDIFNMPPHVFFCGRIMDTQWPVSCGKLVAEPNELNLYYMFLSHQSDQKEFKIGFYYDRNKNRNLNCHFWAHSNNKISYCRNWFEKAFYSIQLCENDKQKRDSFCVSVTDVNEKSHVLYETEISGKHKKLGKIVCNPFNDVVAFTEKNKNSYDLYIYHATNNTVKKINFQEDCQPFYNSTGGIGSGAISIDWKRNGSVAVIGKNSQVWALYFHYNRSCEALYINTLPPGELDSIKEIALDYHNVYWLPQNAKEVKLMNQETGPPTVTMSQFYFLRGHVEHIGFAEKIFHIDSISPQLLINYLQPDLYVPFISSLNIVMVSPTTAKLTSVFNWTPPLTSLHPPLEILIRHKEILPGELDDCFGPVPETILCIETIKEPIKLTRRNNLVTHIPNLRKNRAYFVEVQAAINQMGFNSSVKKNQNFNATFDENENTIAIISASVAAVFISVVFVAVFCWSLRSRIWPYRNLHMFTQSQLRVVKTIGEGYFGQVKEAYLTNTHGRRIHVAVKILKQTADEEAKKCFLEEAIILSHLAHKNIVTIVGICLSTRPNMMALEYVNGGNLVEYLKSSDNETEASVLYKICLDICQACKFLTLKGYIHRDIRADNVLIKYAKDQNKKFKKAILADFGLAKDRGSQNVPYKTYKPQCCWSHSAPESFDGYFSQASDVYMFGNLLWEIFSFGKDLPFKNVPHEEIEQRLKSDERPPKPEKCPDLIYELMKACWHKQPKERPIFAHILASLDVEIKLNSPNLMEASPPPGEGQNREKTNRGEIEAESESETDELKYYRKIKRRNL